MKKFFKKKFLLPIIGIFTAFGLNNFSNTNQDIPQIQKQRYSIEQNIGQENLNNSNYQNSIENSFRTHKFRTPIQEPTQKDLDEIDKSKDNSSHKKIKILKNIEIKINNNQKISDDEFQFLVDYVKTLENKNDSELKWYEKNARYFLNIITCRDNNNNLRRVDFTNPTRKFNTIHSRHNNIYKNHIWLICFICL